MARIGITIHGRQYQVACEDGQESHVQKLASYLDRRVGELAEQSGVPGPAGQIAEAHLLVMASLLTADELGDAYDQLEEMRKAPPRLTPDPASIRAAEEARAAASAAKVQLGEAETARRTAEAETARARHALAALQAQEAALLGAARAAQANADETGAALQTALARVAALDAALRGGEDQQSALRAAQAKATQSEAAFQALAARAEEMETALRAAESEKSKTRAALATLSARADGAQADEVKQIAGLESLATRIDAMADRLERAAAR